MVRKARYEDAEFIFGMYMHPKVNSYLLYEPMEWSGFEPIFKELLLRELLFVYESNGSCAGMFKLVPQTHRNEHAVYLGGLAIDPGLRGRGHGFRMLKEILELARGRGFLRIELSVATSNERALHLYEKAGFQKEGMLKRYTYLKKENRYLDEYMMAYLFPLEDAD